MTDRHAWEDELAEQQISNLSAEIDRLTTENEKLEARLLDAVRLSDGWMRKHDKLLGFIQKRPELLKELIKADEQLRDAK